MEKDRETNQQDLTNPENEFLAEVIGNLGPNSERVINVNDTEGRVELLTSLQNKGYIKTIRRDNFWTITRIK